MNTSLDKMQPLLIKSARLLKRGNRIQNTWTRNYKIYVKTLSVPEVARDLCIRDESDLPQFSEDR